jgi:predicted DNA-binding transcriptional regulator YafY
MNRTDRLAAIILLLRSRNKLTAQQLAEIFEVSPRTIYRDIDALCQAYVPIVAEAGPEGGYSLLDTYSLPPVMFTPDEAVAMFLGGSFIAQSKGMPFLDALKTALIKVEDVLPEELRTSARATTEATLFDGFYARGQSVPVEVFGTVNRAILAHRCVQLTYHGARRDRVTERVVAPYGLIYDNRNGAWYLVGHCYLRDDQRMFHLARIEDIAMTDREYETPDTFDLSALQNRGWAEEFVASLEEEQHRIQVKVWKSVSERLRGSWLLRYAGREETGDDKVILTFHDRLPDARYLVCRFGADCEVLEPPELRERMAQYARDLLARHGG